MISSGRCVPMPVMPIPAFAVPYAAPIADWEELCNGFSYLPSPFELSLSFVALQAPASLIIPLDLATWANGWYALLKIICSKWDNDISICCITPKSTQSVAFRLTEEATPAKPKNGAYAIDAMTSDLDVSARRLGNLISGASGLTRT